MDPHNPDEFTERVRILEEYMVKHGIDMVAPPSVE